MKTFSLVEPGPDWTATGQTSKTAVKRSDVPSGIASKRSVLLHTWSPAEFARAAAWEDKVYLVLFAISLVALLLAFLP